MDTPILGSTKVSGDLFQHRKVEVTTTVGEFTQGADELGVFGRGVEPIFLPLLVECDHR